MIVIQATGTTGSSGAERASSVLSGAGGAGPIERVLDEVEDAAEQILAEAEAEAKRRLEAADALLRRAEVLLRELEDATEGLGPQDPSRAPAGPGPASPPDVKAPEGAILLATQMAVAGASPDQIEQRLRDDFGIEDPDSVLGDDLS